MTRTTPSHDDERAAQEAVRWFSRLQGGDASVRQWDAFEAWLGRSPANAEAYERLETLWIDLDDLAPLVARGGERRRPPARPYAGISRRRWLAAGGAIAAGIAAATAGIMLWESTPPTTVYATAPGETRQFVLADGTKVRLNAASQIQVRLGRRDRRVQMADAEAVFDVAPDPGRPFLITVGDRQVKVVGTEFNLRRRGDRTVLTVRRGVVEVRPADAPQAPPTRVGAGHQLSHQDGAQGSLMQAISPDAAFAWTSGQLIYRGEPLSQVAEDLSRRFPLPVRVADPATGRMPFSGVLLLDHQADVLRRLQAYAPIDVETRADSVVLHARAPRR